MDNQQKEAGDDSGERGRPDQEHGGGREKAFEIEVVYNGLAKPLEVSKDDLISSLLQNAIAAFGNLPAPHTLALYDVDGEELQDGNTVHNSKIKKGDRLLLRPSTVKAG
jgi:hypothetical protein